MYFTKFFLILVIALVLLLNLTDAGNAGSSAAKAAAETAKKAMQGAAKNGPKIVAAGYVTNSTLDVNVHTKPQSRPGSPKGNKG